MNKSTVLIVGAGPVGLTLGTLLGQSEIKCLVIEKKVDWPHESRAITMTARTLEHLQIINMALPMIKAGIPCERIRYYYKNHEVGQADFRRLQSPFNLILHISQYTISKLLNQAMEKTSTQLLRPYEFLAYTKKDNLFNCQIKNLQTGREETIQTRFLIACDGGKSRVREIQGQPFPGEVHDETFIMTDVVLENFPFAVNERHYFFLPHGRGLVCILPLLDEDGAQIFRIVTMIDKTVSYNNKQILDFLQAAFQEIGLSQVKFIKELWTTHFNPRQFVVDHFYQDHIAYAGDAAHTQSPIGSQGLNTGLQDAFNLAWRINLVLSQQASEEVLNQYHDERHQTAVNLLNYNNLQRQRMVKSKPLLKYLVLFMKKLNYFDAINKKEIEQISQLGLHYPQTAQPFNAPSNLQAGLRFPIHLLDKAAYQVYESQLQANTFQCVIWDNGESCSDMINAIIDNYPSIKMTVISQTDTTFDKAQLIVDKSLALHKTMQIDKPTICLVRPDTYIAVSAQGQDCLPAIQSYWQNLKKQD